MLICSLSYGYGPPFLPVAYASSHSICFFIKKCPPVCVEFVGQGGPQRLTPLYLSLLGHFSWSSNYEKSELLLRRPSRRFLKPSFARSSSKDEAICPSSGLLCNNQYMLIKVRLLKGKFSHFFIYHPFLI